MSPGLIELDDIGQQQAVIEGPQATLNPRVRLLIVCCVCAADAAAGEEVVHFPHPNAGYSGLGQLIEQRGTRRWEAGIPTPGGADPSAGLSEERPGDHPRDAVVPLE